MGLLVQNRVPTSKDTAELLWQLRSQISVLPRVAITDGGSEFKGDFTKTVAKFGITHLTTSPHASWMNGQVERIHRTLNDWVRATLQESQYESFSIDDLKHIVKESIIHYNQTKSTSTKMTPHQMIFTFPAWPFNDANEFRPNFANIYFPKPDEIEETIPSSFQTRTPVAGENWFVKVNKKIKNKLDPVFVPCKIVRHLKNKLFKISINKNVTTVHRKELKFAPPAAFKDLETTEESTPTLPRHFRDRRQLSFRPRSNRETTGITLLVRSVGVSPAASPANS